jgi:hypothetical protein
MPLSINTVTSEYKLNYYITGLVRLIQGLCAVTNSSLFSLKIFQIMKFRVVLFQHLMVLLLIGVHQVNVEEWVVLFIQVGIFQ